MLWERCGGSRSACPGGVAEVAMVIASGDGFNLPLAYTTVNTRLSVCQGESLR